MEVHNQLGCGFLEAVYQEALANEFTRQDIPFHQEYMLDIIYKGEKLKQTYRADFLCFDEVVVELKALSNLSSVDEAQVLNYLRASSLETGLLLNFGAIKLEYKRMIWTGQSNPSASSASSADKENDI